MYNGNLPAMVFVSDGQHGNSFTMSLNGQVTGNRAGIYCFNKAEDIRLHRQ
ncbi:MAG: hypothetical protein LBU34_15775 [Planctomycetaceae bacterium]|jgi:hypothetical protein|nr:hypothetical protein [Planctomycetaceae bacterium]